MPIPTIPNVAIDEVAMQHGFAARFYAAYCRGMYPSVMGIDNDGQPFAAWDDLSQHERDRWQGVADFALNVLLFGKDYNGPNPCDRVIKCQVRLK